MKFLNQHFKGNHIVDSTGQLFEQGALKRISPYTWWKWNAPTFEIEFRPLQHQMTLEEIKAFLTQKIQELPAEGFNRKWLAEVSGAKTIKETLGNWYQIRVFLSDEH